MYLTVFALTATWIAAAPVAPTADANAQAPMPIGQLAAPAAPVPMPTGQAPLPAVQPMPVSPPHQTPAPSTPTLRERLRNLFAPRSAAEVSQPSLLAPTAASRQPMGTVTAQRPDFALSAKDLERVGHEKDYSWITGKLSQVAGQPGRWLLRYAGPYEQDRYGGQVLLSQANVLADLRDGDLICVHGKMLDSSPAGRPPAGFYQVEVGSVIERAPR